MTRIAAKTVFVIVVDIICILIIGLPSLILDCLGEPFLRGFYCNDETIGHPYRESTVSTPVLILVSILVPILIFVSVEFSLAKSSGSKSMAGFLHSLYTTTLVFLFGAAVNQLITNLCKYSIGRLRPHFFNVCQPNIEINEENCGSMLQPKFITEFECQGSTQFPTEEEREERIKDARLSFLSGHASLSTYAMLFAIIYLHLRLVNRNYRLVKPLIQVCCALFAIYTSLSRVSDYKHHPEDVICGFLLGILIAVLTHILSADKLKVRSKQAVTTATSTTTLLTLPTRTYSHELDTESVDMDNNSYNNTMDNNSYNNLHNSSP